MEENRTETEENRKLTGKERRLANLKRDAGPGRPKGQRNYSTIYREALEKLAAKNEMEPDQLETELLEKAILTARKGDYRFYKDLLDRLHGQAQQKIDHTTKGESLNYDDAAIDRLIAAREKRRQQGAI